MDKTPEMKKLLDNFTEQAFGRKRSVSQANAICVCCGGDATQFSDELSRKEFSISGMCEICQQSVFGSSDGDEEDFLFEQDGIYFDNKKDE